MDPRLEELLAHCLCLDLETGPRGELRKIGALHKDRSFLRQGRFDVPQALRELDVFAGDARLLLGHNLLGHDLPILREHQPDMQLLTLDVIDTLFLSPLAFPDAPFHRLNKSYKLVRATVSDPVEDSRLARDALRQQWEEFERRREVDSRLFAVYRFCFRGASDPDQPQGITGIARIFDALGIPHIELPRVIATLEQRWSGRTCSQVARHRMLDFLREPAKRPALAYATAWIDATSHQQDDAQAAPVLPPWVRHQFPDTAALLADLRDHPCADPHCHWCRNMHDPERQLQRFFGFPGFRAEPATSDGRSLQSAIVAHGMANGSHLAILPTGGGKSLCFQIPALVRNQRRGQLTMVISPLQALMKDQVDNLVRKTGVTSAAALYGMLTMPERGRILEQVRQGRIALLYVSPEQLRNRSLHQALLTREIGAWVFDEAHCLSKWGHDFRPDYLYAARFIRRLAAEQQAPVPAIGCFTATAKAEVIEEIRAHFRNELDVELELFEGGIERDNLSFAVHAVPRKEQGARLIEVLQAELEDGEAAVVYANSRRKTEELAELLGINGFRAAHFHAGLEAGEKHEILERFTDPQVAPEQRLDIICATNAFGMGVDKDDVRLVVHAEVPGSIENYLQEAGRAGRDRQPARCILFHDEQDIEDQFRLQARNTLLQSDLQSLLRGLRRARKSHNGATDQDVEIEITSGELLRSSDLSLDDNKSTADTRVKVAIAWLERADFLERDDNCTSVFQGRPQFRDLSEAAERMRTLGLSQEQQERWLAVLKALLDAGVDKGMSSDELATLPVFDDKTSPSLPWNRGETAGQRVMRTLHDLAEAGLLHAGPQLSALLRSGIRNASDTILEHACILEQELIGQMRELAPETDRNTWLTLSLPRINQALCDAGIDSDQETLRILLAGLTQDGRGLAGNRPSAQLRLSSRNHYRIRFLRNWKDLAGTVERRHQIAGIVLAALLGKITPAGSRGAHLLVTFGTDELHAALQQDALLAGELTDPLAGIERALLFLHDINAIVLQSGAAVFRQAMTLRILQRSNRRRYSKGDYAPLHAHNQQRIFQIHAMHAYARLGLENIRQARAFVLDYFRLDHQQLVRRHFSERQDMLERATTAESWRRIVENLGNPVQTAIVAATEEGNRLILAGPGSGKTRVIVHRCGYLLRVVRVDPRAILILCFNRNAALELRHRLRELVGDDARGVTIQTYHGFAMRLSGHSFAERCLRSENAAQSEEFRQVIREAIRLLKGEIELPGIEPDTLRERLLAGYRHILVDEYQDIDEDQYELIGAIAGRSTVSRAASSASDEEDSKLLTLLAVGDDDQNIYRFRGARVEFIRRFQRDYAAEVHHLLENYRSSAHIIAAANALITRNSERMKSDQELRIDHHRARQPAGGRWEQIDERRRGRVEILEVDGTASQAAALCVRMQQLRELGGDPWSDFAVLAFRHETLDPVRALCEQAGIPTARRCDIPSLHRIREIARFLAFLHESPQSRYTVAGLDAMIPVDTNPWHAMLHELLGQWATEAGELAHSADTISEFCYESLEELGRNRQLGQGVLLTTLHGAKGLEFRHVLIADGQWGQNGKEDIEDKRRQFYVGMTRARETLTIGSITQGGNPCPEEYSGPWSMRSRAHPPAPAPEIVARRYHLLGLVDIDLGFAGRHGPNDPIHRRLAGLQTGDPLQLRQSGTRILLCTRAGDTVGCLSKKAAEHWLPRLDRVLETRLIALLERYQRDSSPEHRERCQCRQWECPLVEIVERA